jgi:uracil-DNA glycosylase
MPTTDWNPLLRAELDKPYWRDLQDFVAYDRARNVVYPPPDEVFAALHRTSYAGTKVLILGQDPYHGPRQAHGLCFSVQRGVQIPPSLRNIHQELHDDLGLAIPDHGNLEQWADQGVLLLNATLTVRAGAAGSHQKKGWETFTDEVIRVVSAKPDHVVFILWGSYARRKKDLIDRPRHTIIESPHPSPLSASSGFFGSRPFSRANAALMAAGRQPVDWSLTDEATADDGTRPGVTRRGVTRRDERQSGDTKFGESGLDEAGASKEDAS